MFTGIDEIGALLSVLAVIAVLSIINKIERWWRKKRGLPTETVTHVFPQYHKNDKQD